MIRGATPAADVLSATDEPGGLPRRGPWYAAVAVLAGASLLGGGALAYAQGPHPAPTGYTWLAWTGERPDKVLQVGQSGLTLPVQIEHEQPGTETFRLTAGWSSASCAARPKAGRSGGASPRSTPAKRPSPLGARAFHIALRRPETIASSAPASASASISSR